VVAVSLVTTVVTLRNLSNFLSSALDASTGIILILDGSDIPLASSVGLASAGNPNPLSAALTGAVADRSASEETSGSFNLLVGNEKYLAAQMRLDDPGSPDWKVAVALRESAFTGRLVSADRTTLALLVIMLVLYVIVGLVVVNTVTSPIRELQQAMANIDLTDSEVTDILSRLALKKNEIGNLAESFLKMHIRIGSDYDSLRNSLREKELLLKEVHHRVKNNLQIVSSMLSLQAGTVEDPGGRQMIMQCQDRIQAMAYVHEDAYSSGRLTGIQMRSYLSRICESLQKNNNNTELEISVIPEDLTFSLDDAIPCGLIVNELVTNSLKHAFTEEKNGTISISLEAAGKQAMLSVRDNGSGMDPDGQSKGLGNELLLALSMQLGGSVLRENSDGVCVTVSFPTPVFV
jgi:two-component sensor histidine kinase